MQHFCHATLQAKPPASFLCRRFSHFPNARALPPGLRSCQWLSAADKQKSEARHCSWAFKRGRGVRDGAGPTPHSPISALDTELVTFQFSHTLCGFPRTAKAQQEKPRRGPERQRKAKNPKRNQSERLKWKPKLQARGRGRCWHGACSPLTTSLKVQIKIQ